MKTFCVLLLQFRSEYLEEKEKKKMSKIYSEHYGYIDIEF